MRNFIPSWVRVLTVFFLIFIGIEYFVESGDRPAFMAEPMIMLFLVLVLFILIAIEGIVAAVERVLFNGLDEAGKERYLKNKNKTPQFKKLKRIYEKLIDSKPVEAEAEIILDHNYDGIKELDNNLPPWWLYGFYASIVFAAIYLVKYHVFNGENQYMELERDYAEAQVEIDKYNATAKDRVDFESVVLLTDAADISAGKAIFEKNCVACHAIDGGGGIGPNLTDKYWILGGGINNVFKTISKGGRSGKGMESWSRKGLKASQIAQVASYVLTFEGTTPSESAKGPEGEIWEAPKADAETETEVEKVTDSVKTVTEKVKE
ncbi:cbb3-type cytochrome c oxidase N-terminal domain-containing protein [Kordia sp.]|uniref:cbb3-type cytochrome c oxidase N-terminal domain-containing protein n=1 Tax=Kordia sp. TaxID=1965332 RepID=UPI003B5BF157